MAAIDIAGSEPKTVWRAEIEGTPTRMLAADAKLFVVTAEGAILAFAAPADADVTRHVMTEAPLPAADEWTAKAAAVLEATDASNGYALVLGIDNGRLVEELVRQSELHVIAVDHDADKVMALRERLFLAGLYGTRASVLVGNPVTYAFPPFLANLVVSETPDVLAQAGQQLLAEAVFHTLRPYGGVACAWGTLADHGRIEEIARGEAFPGASVRQVGDFVLLARSGPLPGAADWSHAEADAASTGASADELRAPASVLWFDASRRWHKFPGQVQVRVAGGRLVLYENRLLQVTDVYTGRMLWERDLSVDSLDHKGIRYARHRQWGPEASLSPHTELVAVDDTIYLSDGTACVLYAPDTGEPIGSIDLPDGLTAPWANLRVNGDYLVGSSGQHILCLNRRTKELLWQVEATRSSLYLAVGGDKVFCSELANPRRGEDASRDGSIFALDLATGERLWQRAGGARLRYSPALDIVVTTAGLYRGSDGEPVPKESEVPSTQLVVTGRGLPNTGLPGLIAGQKLLAGSDDTLEVYELPSVRRIGDPMEWVRRGCTGTRASTHLLTTRYRSNSAWIDLDSREITPFLGIRPGCQVNNNLYPANGVMNIPNLTAGCTCNFAPASIVCVPASVIRPGQSE